MNLGGIRGRWSHYRFPWTIEKFAHLKDSLYLRHGDTVSRVYEHHQSDNDVNFDAIIQWPWLDFGKPGRDKMMMGFDNVGEGVASFEIGYNQNNLAAFTTPFDLPVDSAPGEIIPMPVMGPSFSIRLTYNSAQVWEWNSLDIFVEDMDIGK